MELDKYVLSFVTFTLVFLVGMFMVGDINANYDDVDITTEEFGDVYNQTDELFELQGDVKGSILEKEIDEDDTETSMFSGAFKALKFIRGTFKLMGDVMQSVANVIGLPQWIVTLGVISMSVLVIFAIVFLVFRFQGR